MQAGSLHTGATPTTHASPFAKSPGRKPGDTGPLGEPGKPFRMEDGTVHHAEPPGSRRLTKCVRAFIFVTVPTILRIRGYRIGFFQADLAEPPHVHVRRQSGEAKFWLDTIAVAGSRGFRPHEIREIATILEDHKHDLMAAWYAEEAKRGDSSGENSDG